MYSVIFVNKGSSTWLYSVSYHFADSWWNWLRIRLIGGTYVDYVLSKSGEYIFNSSGDIVIPAQPFQIEYTECSV